MNKFKIGDKVKTKTAIGTLNNLRGKVIKFNEDGWMSVELSGDIPRLPRTGKIYRFRADELILLSDRVGNHPLTKIFV